MKGAKTGGRAKGTLNKATADVRKLAQQHTAEAIAGLVAIMNTSESDAARVAAIKELLDRGHGKSAQPIDGDGEGGPVQFAVRWLPASDEGVAT